MLVLPDVSVGGPALHQLFEYDPCTAEIVLRTRRQYDSPCVS